MKGTIFTIGWLKYHLFLNQLKTKKTFYIVSSLIFFAFVFYGSFTFGAVFHVLNSLVGSENAFVVRELTHLFSLGIFLGWCALSVFTGITSSNIRQLFGLSLFPLSFKWLYTVSTISGLFGYWIVIFGPAFLWLMVSLKLTSDLLSVLSSLSSILLFVTVTHLLIHILSSWVETSIRILRNRKLFSALFFLILIVLLNSASIVCRNYIGSAQTVSELLLRLRLSRYLVFTPPGLLANLLFNIRSGRYAEFLLASLPGLLAYLVFAWWIGYKLAEKALFESFSKPKKINAGQRSDLFEKMCDFFKAAIPSHYLPIVVREMLYLIRYNRIRLMFGLLLIGEFTLPLIYGYKNEMSFLPLMGIFVPFGMFFYPFINNIFALESKGIVNNFVLPFDKRTILMGKNIALFLTHWMFLIPGLLWIFYLSWKQITSVEILSFVMFFLYLTSFNAFWGNIISVYFPLPLRFDAISGRFMPNSAHIFLVLGMLVALFPAAVNVYVFYYLHHMPGLMSTIFAILFVLVLIIYKRSLLKVAHILESRKEEIITQFCRDIV